VLGKYDELTFKKIVKTTERIFYVLKKINWLFCLIMVI
jgi:hypothetical protein